MPKSEIPRCARCSSPLVEISIAKGESSMTMQSCSTCDTRSWIEGGRPVDLSDVLGAVTPPGKRK